jgi:hypothetical protein
MKPVVEFGKLMVGKGGGDLDFDFDLFLIGS